MGVRVLRAPSRPPQSCLPVGTRTRARALRACDLGVPAPARRDLCCRVRVARGADTGARRPRRNPASGRISRGGAADARRFGLSRPAYAVLAELERHRVDRGNRHRRAAGSVRHPGSVDATRAHRFVRALPVICLRRPGLHEFPVGSSAAGNGLSGHIPCERIPDRGLALSLAGVPLFSPGRRGQASLGRSDVARLDRARISLLDAAPPYPACVVRRATPTLGADRRHGRHARGGARQRRFHFSAAAPARPRSLVLNGVPGVDRVYGELQLLQPPQRIDVHSALR